MIRTERDYDGAVEWLNELLDEVGTQRPLRSGHCLTHTKPTKYSQRVREALGRPNLTCQRGFQGVISEFARVLVSAFLSLSHPGPDREWRGRSVAPLGAAECLSLTVRSGKCPFHFASFCSSYSRFSASSGVSPFISSLRSASTAGWTSAKSETCRAAGLAARRGSTS